MLRSAYNFLFVFYSNKESQVSTLVVLSMVSQYGIMTRSGNISNIINFGFFEVNKTFKKIIFLYGSLCTMRSYFGHPDLQYRIEKIGNET